MIIVKKGEVKNGLQKLFSTGFFHIFSSGVINKILTFLSNVVVVRFVSKIEYGIFAYADNIVSLVLLATGMGLVSGTFQLCSEKSGIESEKIFQYGSSIGIKINILLCIIIAIISQFLPIKFEAAREYLLLMCINPILLIIFDFQQIYFRSNLENKKYAFSSSLNTLLVVTGAIIGVVIMSVNGMIIGRNIAYVVTLIFIFFKLNVPIKLYNNTISKNDKFILFKISIISMLNNGMTQLLYLLGVFLVGLILVDETAIASYKVAIVIPTAMAFIPNAMVTYIYPYFARHKEDKKWCLKNYKRIIKYFGGINLVIAILMVVFAKDIITIIYGEQYIDAVACFRVLSINYFVAGTFRTITNNLLVAQRKLEFNFMVNIISAGINIAGNFALIPVIGSLGAALSTLISIIITSALTAIYYIYIIKK